MNKVFKTFARTISIATITALVWGVTGALPASGPLQAGQTGQASAATLTVQSVSVAPLNAPSSAPGDGKGAKSPSVPETAAGTGFTYQGRLMDNSVPANGQYDLRFALFDALSGGNQVSSFVNITNQTVTSGLFTVSLDFGSSAFYGDARWLEIAVKPSGGSFTTLSPRQPLTATPYSLSSRWEGTTGKPFPYNPLRQPNTLTTIDPGGQNAAIGVGSDGLGLISYQDSTSHTMKVAHCSNIECNSATIATIDATANAGYSSAITIGSDGLGLIVYNDGATASQFRVAHCTNLACSFATISTLAQGNIQNPSITIGTDGLGIISYLNMDIAPAYLKVAHCSNVNCSSATTTTIDQSYQRADNFAPITIGADGMPFIPLYLFGMKGVHCSDQACSSFTEATIDNNSSQYLSVATGADGLPLISYSTFDSNLKVAHCSNVACSSSTLTTLATSVARYTSTTIGADGLGIISYYDATAGALAVAHCTNPTCSSATISTIETAYAGLTSVAMGQDGLGLVSFAGGSMGSVKVLHCANPLCVSYQHRR